MNQSNSGKSDERIGVQSMETGLSVLTAFVGAERMPMLKTLAERLNMHPAKVHRYLVSLCRAGYVEQDEYTGRYKLGRTALRLGFAAIESIDIMHLARPVLQKLNADLNLSTTLAIWGNSGPVVALQEFVSAQITITAHVGTVMPLLQSSTGRMFGAWLPEGKTKSLINKELAENNATSKSGLLRTREEVIFLFNKIRERGLSRATGELNPSINSLSAPIFNGVGEIVAVVSVIGGLHELDNDWDGTAATTLRKAALGLSQEMGYTNK